MADFATEFITKLNGMDVTDLQKLLGHTRISTTMIYAKVTQENVRYSHHRYVV